MKSDCSHIKKIHVVSNTHWDREFRESFEKTRRNLIRMLDKTLSLLEEDADFKSYTMDGHSIMIDDYLEMRPEKRDLIEKMIKGGRLIIGPYYTLAEQFSIHQESLIRNLMLGRKKIRKYGGPVGTVAYTPSSWGQTGQLPQILNQFGLDKAMFYRGISHHEADAEYIWQAPDGSRVFASRFALYARYNWYYWVHRQVTKGRVFDKGFQWGEFDEAPYRDAYGGMETDPSIKIIDPKIVYDRTQLKKAIESMIDAEGQHFMSDTFLAMNGHDISVPYPIESQIIRDAKEIMCDKYEISHGSLEEFWDKALETINQDELVVLEGERRAYLKEGMWTFLFPSTISARTYLKQMDYSASLSLVSYAEPLSVLASIFGAKYPKKYMDRGWKYLLSNHTHDANGGCAPDLVCQDMEYRYRKVLDIAEIIQHDAMTYLSSHIQGGDDSQDIIQLIVYNSLPFERDVIVPFDIEVPQRNGCEEIQFYHVDDKIVDVHIVDSFKSSVFADNIWDVPTISDGTRLKGYSKFSKIPALGYRVYEVIPSAKEKRTQETLVVAHNRMENEYLSVEVNGNGSINVLNKKTGKEYRNLNYLSDQGEVGNAWEHIPPIKDRIYNSLGCQGLTAVVLSSRLKSSIEVFYEFKVPKDYGDGRSRSQELIGLPVKITYSLEAGSKLIDVKVEVDNKAMDHWLRVNFPTNIQTDVSITDSHFNILERGIKIPDSSGWVEKAWGFQPLNTFAEIKDANNSFTLIPKGLFEYEVMDQPDKTMSLTLIRGCRIKLAVSEEKQTELPDMGVQCLGKNIFEYGIYIHEGEWENSRLLNEVKAYNSPVRIGMCGRGKGALPKTYSYINCLNDDIDVSAIKEAEDGRGAIIRFVNPSAKSKQVYFEFGNQVKEAVALTMDEEHLLEEVNASVVVNGNQVSLNVPGKKIVTLNCVI